MNEEQLNTLHVVIDFMNDAGLDLQPLDSLVEAVSLLEQFADNCTELDEGDDSLATGKYIYPFPKIDEIEDTGCMYDHDHSQGGCEVHN